MRPSTRRHCKPRSIAGTPGGAAVMAAMLALAGCAQPAPCAPATTARSMAPPSAPAGTAAPAAGPVHITLHSTVLGEERTILVRTPPAYRGGTDRHPVLYLTDGEGQIAHTAATIEYLAGHALMPEMIVVGITHIDRTRDLTPTTVTGRPTSGGADRFLEFVEKELVPHVDRTYRTDPYRVFAGHSLGGLFAVHALVQKPDLFHAVIAVAPSLDWDNGWVMKRFEQLLVGRPELDRTLFVTLADEDGEMLAAFEELQRMAARKAPKGFRFGAARMPQEDHGSVVLPSHYAGFRKVFDGWSLADYPETQPVTKAIETLDAHYAALSRRFGFDIATPETLLNQLGYQLLEDEVVDDAITAFQRTVERYPRSANAHDSLGEAYENKGQLELAVTSYARAAKLAEQNGQPTLEAFRRNLARATAKLGRR